MARMPDKRRHRGPHPQDRELFARRHHATLRTAVSDLSWLLGRGYGMTAALTLVGDHFQLAQRQRLAVRRSACSGQALEDRRRRQLLVTRCRGRAVAVDGFNLLITLESALSGGLVIIGREGCARDLASIWGTYRRIEETVGSIRLLRDFLQECGIDEVRVLLDRPVSNSGRLKILIAEQLSEDNSWSIELVDNPDAVLVTLDVPVVSSDAWVLDSCGSWLNLAAEIIEAHVAAAWTIDLRLPVSAQK